MSILLQSSNGWIISHELFIKNIYSKVYDGDDCVSLEFDEKTFKIEEPFIKGVYNDLHIENDQEDSSLPLKKLKQLNNESRTDHETSENEWVHHHFILLLNCAKSKGLFLLSNKNKKLHKSNKEAKLFSHEFYNQFSNEDLGVFSGGNSSDVAVVADHNNSKYIFPPNCTFFCNDVLNIQSKIDFLKKYDVVLLDPPWWNKYIRRKKSKASQSSYQMMYNKDLKDLSLSSILSPESIVVVWCTNSPTHINILKNEIFPAWGVKYLCKWYWVKVTQSGDPICPFSEPPRKQPFEQIIFGYNGIQPTTRPLPEDGKLVVGVPSAIHSHKPPLSELLAPYLPDNPKCLELFARYLLPSWTSWGNEVLKLQNILIYQNIIKSSK